MVGRVGVSPSQQPVIRPRADTQQAERRLRSFAQQQERLFAKTSTSQVRQAKQFSQAQERIFAKTSSLQAKEAEKVVKAEAARRLKFRQEMEKGFASQQSRLTKLDAGAADKARAAQTRLNRELQAGSGAFNRLSSAMGLTNTQFAQLLGAGITGSATVLGIRLAIDGLRVALQLLGQSVVDASNRFEAFSAVKVVFKEAAGSLDSFIRTSQGLGLSQRAAADAARSFGVLLANVGETNVQAARASVFLTQLAADLASFANITGGVEEAQRLLLAGLVGETETLRRLGIVIDDVSTSNKALELGIVQTGEQLSQQTKILVRLIQVSQQTRDIQGDFSNTAQGLANTLRVLGAVQEDVRAEIGALLVPAVVKAAQAFVGLLQGIRNIIIIFRQLPGPVKVFLAAITGLGPAALIFNRFAKAGRETFDATVKNAEAQRAHREAIEAETAAIATQIQAIERRNKLVDEGGDLLIREAQLNIQLKQALLSVREAALAIEQAERTLRDARQAQTDVLLDQRDAYLSLRTAQLDQRRGAFIVIDAERELRRSQEDLVFAQQDFIKLQQESTDNSLKVAEATLGIREAQLALQEATLGSTRALQEQLDAQLALIDAEFDLERAQRRGRAGARDQLRAIVAIQRANLQTAEATLAPERARIQLARSTLGVTKAEQELQEVLAGTDAQQRFVQAARAVEDAQIRIRDATFDVQGALIRQESLAIAVERAHIGIREAQDAIVDADVAVRAALLGQESSALALISAIVGAAAAEVELESVQAELEGRMLTSKEKTEIFLGALKTLGGDMPAIRDQIRQTREEFDKFPTKKTSVLELQTEQARLEMKLFQEDADQRLKDVTEKASSRFKNTFQDLLHSLQDVVKTVINFILDQLKRIPGLSGIAEFIRFFNRPGPEVFPGRAHGGPLAARQTALVGEKGPELFIPKTAGFVIPANVTAALLALTRMISGRDVKVGTDGAPQILNFNAGAFTIPSLPDYRVLAVAIARELGRKGNR